MEKMKHQEIDVIIPTLNAERPCLKACLENVLAEIPVHHLIIVDSGSTDATLEVVKGYPKVKVIIARDVKLGKARQIGIEAVDTEFFAFIDSDVILYPNWFRKVSSLMEGGVGVVEGRMDETGFDDIIRQKLIQLERRFYAGFHEDGRIDNTLYRTEALRGIKILVPWTEDVFIDTFIRSRGYKRAFYGKEAIVLHNNSIARTNFRERIASTFYECLMGTNSPKKVLREAFIRISLAFFLAHKNYRVLPFYLRIYCRIFVGAMKWVLHKHDFRSYSQIVRRYLSRG
jgi:glycosyltransferase involved in cell wall biosynthesis